MEKAYLEKAYLDVPTIYGTDSDHGARDLT